MIRLVYASQLLPTTTDRVIDEIVARAAAFNQSQGITGLLAVENGKVCQALEGDAARVDSLYEAIRRDPRHHGVLLMDRRDISGQHFNAWGMRRGEMLWLVDMALA